MIAKQAFCSLWLTGIWFASVLWMGVQLTPAAMDRARFMGELCGLSWGCTVLVAVYVGAREWGHLREMGGRI